MKDIVTPVPPEEVRSMIKKSLETAALVNYTRLSNEAKIEGTMRNFLETNMSTNCLFSD
jgi:calcium-dependent secretion activator